MRSTVRQESRLGLAASSCSLCGHHGQVITVSRRMRKGLDLLNPKWEAAPRAYELCPACGARRELEDRLLAA
ncbi:hypothetical protein ACI797_16545 [Geodermatophilus sp. SYSU D00691]